VRRAPQRTKEALYPVGRDQRTAAVREDCAGELDAFAPKVVYQCVVYETNLSTSPQRPLPAEPRESESAEPRHKVPY